MTQNLTNTVEGANKGELFTSFDVDAFEVPGGRDVSGCVRLSQYALQ